MRGVWRLAALCAAAWVCGGGCGPGLEPPSASTSAGAPTVPQTPTGTRPQVNNPAGVAGTGAVAPAAGSAALPGGAAAAGRGATSGAGGSPASADAGVPTDDAGTP